MHPFARLFAAGVAVFGIFKGIEYVNKKRIFISFPIEDKNLSVLLAGQSKNDDTPFEFIDMSVKEPWDSAWKTNCRARIKSCHGVIALVTKNLAKADGALWEIKCAKEEKIPLMLMYGNSEQKSFSIPSEISGMRIQDWGWSNIKKFVANL